MSDKMVISMAWQKDTKGTHVYAEVDGSGQPVDASAGAKVPTLYIRKAAFNGSGAPKAITLTIDAI